MSILNYFSKDGSLPNPRGLLSARVPSLAISAANREVRAAIEEQRKKKSKKRGPYTVFTAQERARIGKYALDHGVTAARRWYMAWYSRVIKISLDFNFAVDRSREI